MIFELNEEKLTQLAIAACPNELRSCNADDYCMLLDDDVYYAPYKASVVAICRACWLKWLFKESEDNHG